MGYEIDVKQRVESLCAEYHRAPAAFRVCYPNVKIVQNKGDANHAVSVLRSIAVYMLGHTPIVWSVEPTDDGRATLSVRNPR